MELIATFANSVTNSGQRFRVEGIPSGFDLLEVAKITRADTARSQ